MYQRVLAVVFILFLLSSGVFSEEVYKSILPRHREFSNWARPKEPEYYDTDSLSGYINGAAEIFLQYGFVDLYVARYLLVSGEVKKEITLELYRMDSPEDAFGIFSLERTGEERISRQIEGLNWVSETQINLVKGEFFVNIVGFECEEKELELFAAFVSRRIKGDGKAFPLLSLLPTQRLIPASRKYIKGETAASGESVILGQDFWGFKDKTRAVSARYRPSGSVVVILDFAEEIEGLDEEVKELFEENFEEVVMIDSMLQGKNSSGDYFLFGHEGNKAVLVLGEPELEFAQLLLNEALKNAQNIVESQ
jgi:hypothetical protein